MINDCASNSPIDHAVELIGYTPTHWIIKNSWGQWWGDHGFGYVSRAKDCGIKSYIIILS
jgi:C1A family cysteine protease